MVLLEAGHELVVLDNFDNSSPEALRRVKELAEQRPHRDRGRCPRSRGPGSAFRAKDTIDGVIHFAGLKAVGESVSDPLRYWDVNVSGSRALATAMERHGCRAIVFSSTSTVAGNRRSSPCGRTCPRTGAPLRPDEAGGRTDAQALCRSGPWRVACLRYFNPVGAHPSGRIGEDPLGTPNNLSLHDAGGGGRRERLRVFGDDYLTHDGTGIRDYIHVMDLAEAHAVTLDHLLQQPTQSHLTLNIGTGNGLSVLDVVKGFETATGQTIPYDVVERRPGDVPRCRPARSRPKRFWAGPPVAASTTCVAMDGPGSRPIPWVIATRHEHRGPAAGRRRPQPCAAAQTLGDAAECAPEADCAD